MPGWLAALALALSAPTAATTQMDFTVEDLIRFSHFAAHVRVETVSCDATPVCTYRFRVIAPVFGKPADSFTLRLLAGIDEMPSFARGEEAVVFVNLDNRVEPVIGLRRGTSRVRGGKMFDYEGRPLTITGTRLDSRRQGPPVVSMSVSSFTAAIARMRTDLGARGVRLLSE